jgi:hypothetical protein
MAFRGVPTARVDTGSRLTEQRFCADDILLRALPEVQAIMPTDWFAEVNIAAEQRAVIFLEGVPVLFLRPGVHPG